MKLKLPYEIKPYILSQKWGETPLNAKGRPLYEQFGFTQHNGVDILPGIKKEIRAPFPYEVRWTVWMPNGGGNVLGILSQDEYEAPDGKPAYVLIDYLHLESFAKFPGGIGYKGDTGDLLGITGNTGFSTGPHTHAQYRWVRKDKKSANDLKNVEKNKAHDSFDPEPYRNGLYALDLSEQKKIDSASKVLTDVQKIVTQSKDLPAPEKERVYAKLRTLLSSVLAGLK